MEFSKSKDSEDPDYVKYLTDHEEMMAMTTQIQEELHSIFLKNNKISLIKALEESLVYNRYYDAVEKTKLGIRDDKIRVEFNRKVLKLKKIILGKIVNFWKNELGGKVKNERNNSPRSKI